MKIDLNSREFLIKLREEALTMANNDVHVTYFWENLYRKLAEAADNLDACLARSEIRK